MAGGSFTRPTELPEWASQDVNLPATSNANKVTTSLTQRQTGFDYLELPTAEQENWWRNNVWCWSGYLDDQVSTLRTDVTALQNEADSAVNVNDAFVDIGPLRIAFSSQDLSVPDAVGSNAQATHTFPNTFGAPPLQVQLTNLFSGTGIEGTEMVPAVGNITATTVDIHTTRLAGSNVGGTEILTVGVMAIGLKP